MATLNYIRKGGKIATVALAATSSATNCRDLFVGRNLTVAGNINITNGDIVKVSGDVPAGGISAGAGLFEGEYAGAIRAQFVTESGFGVGANVGFSEDSVGGGVGASMKF